MSRAGLALAVLALTLLVAVAVGPGVAKVDPFGVTLAAEIAKKKKKCKKGHKRNKAGKCVKRKRGCGCPGKPPVGTKPPPGYRPPQPKCLLNPCRVIASDTAANPDPLPFWGAIDCVEPKSARYATPQTGGDPQPTANGTPQFNTAYRRTTVFDGDNFFGERCELGQNSWQHGPVAFYREGDHMVTYFSLRLPANFPLAVFDWQGGMQIKQAQESDGGGGVPILSLSAFEQPLAASITRTLVPITRTPTCGRCRRRRTSGPAGPGTSTSPSSPARAVSRPTST